MQARLVFMVLVAAFAFAAQPAARADDGLAKWTGKWNVSERETDYKFTLVLREHGGFLAGELTQVHHNDKSAFATIHKGVLLLSFRDRSRPDDEGRAELTLQPDGKQFSGDCRYSGSNSYVVHWTGTKARY